jgi:putative Mg2+ transporter-C (MgtC) family protein
MAKETGRRIGVEGNGMGSRPSVPPCHSPDILRSEWAVRMQQILSADSDAYAIAPRLIVALLLGMAIGVERQLRQRHTGLNTHALVALGAAAFTSLGALLGQSTDVRLGGQVVTGIGFLGAGLIMRDGLNVRGLSGAATIWATGAVGVLVGYGYMIAATEATAFVVVVNLVSPRLSQLLNRYAPEYEIDERYYTIELKCAAREEALVRTMLLRAITARKLRLHSLESHAVKDLGHVKVEAVVFSLRDDDALVEDLVGELSLSPSVFSASWTLPVSPE